MKTFIKVMKALSDPNRVRLIKMLQHKSMCVCEMQTALQVSQPTVSKHLKLVGHAGLVRFGQHGLWVNCYLTEGSSSPYAASVLGNLSHWLEDDAPTAELLEELPTVRREDISKK